MATDKEMVRILAERVMGWTYWDGGFSDESLWMLNDDVVRRAFDWNPLESWADAGMLLNRLVELKVFAGLQYSYRSETWACIVHGTVIKGYKRPERAISQAAYEWAIAQEAVQK